MPRLSVVVPSRDTRELALRCLDSCLAAGGDVELLLVDDGSQDQTSEAVAARFPQVVRLRHPEPRGFTASANLGLARGQGEILVLLNSDTELEPGALASLLAAFDERPRLGVAGGALSYFDGRPQWSGGREPTGLWLFALASGLGRALERAPGYRRLKPLAAGRQGRVDWVSGAAMALRRTALEQVGPLRDVFAFYCQDLELCSRMRRAGWEVDLVPGFRVRHHAGGTIRRSAGALAGANPSLLWPDLVRYARLGQGRLSGARALAALRAGARLRLVARGFAAPFAGSRQRWRQDTQALKDALASLARVEREPPSDGPLANPPKLL